MNTVVTPTRSSLPFAPSGITRTRVSRERSVRFSPADRARLWTDYKRWGSSTAREQLIDQYHYLVPITVRRFLPNVPRSVEADDLFSVGRIALIRAVDQFDPSRGIKFETYAINLIRGAVLELQRSEDWAPRSVRRKMRLLEGAYAKLQLQYGRPATEQEVAAELGIDVESLHTALDEVDRASLLSLDDLFRRDSGDSGTSLIDQIPDDSATGAGENAVAAEQRRDLLKDALEHLPERERRVIEQYYLEGRTFKEIGTAMGVSESRAFQLHRQALLRMRASLDYVREVF